MATMLLCIAVCFLAYSNGANDNFKGVASLFGCGAASYRRALAWATTTTLAGSFCALFLAQALLIKFSGKGLASDALIQSLPFMIAVAGGAGLTVILATRLGFPISTTHALLGALAGSALVVTWGDMNLAALRDNFMLPLLLSPVAAVFLAMLLYLILKQLRQVLNIDKPLCMCVENEPLVIPALADLEVRTLTLPQNAMPQVLTFDRQEACASRSAGILLGIDVQRAVDTLHFVSAGAVCFARGLNDTPKIAALLLLMPGFSMQGIIVLVAAAMALGGLLNARRVAETMSRKITPIGRGQGLATNLTTALLVIFASNFGMPVSTTHVSVGSLFGIGLAQGTANARTIVSILLSWLLTLPCAAVCGAGIYRLSAAF